jgi:hypothetical protein
VNRVANIKLKQAIEGDGNPKNHVPTAPAPSPFVPGDLVSDKQSGHQGTVVQIPSPYYVEVHIKGRRELIQNSRLVLCNSPAS